MIHGALYYLPVLIVDDARQVRRRREGPPRSFAEARDQRRFPRQRHALPPDAAAHDSALDGLPWGSVFGIIFGKEVFGGTGMNFLNPALVGRAFLFFAYPAYMSGDAPWIAANFSRGRQRSPAQPGWPRQPCSSGALEAASWWAGLLRLRIPGLDRARRPRFACLLGAAFLLMTRIASWRTMAGVTAGHRSRIVVACSICVSSTTNPSAGSSVLLALWCSVAGHSGLVFMATDPGLVGLQRTCGKWGYGIGIGATLPC